MNEAMQLFFNLFGSAITLFFALEILPGVSLGWILITVVIISLILFYFKGGKGDA